MQYFTDTDMGLDLGQVNLSVESAFADHGKGLVQMPPKVYITLPEGDFRTMPAYLPSLSIAGVKIVNVHPKNPQIRAPDGHGPYHHPRSCHRPASLLSSMQPGSPI